MRSSILVVLVGGLATACARGGDETTVDAAVYGEQCQPGGSFDVSGRAAVLGTLNVHVDASGLVEVDTTAELLIAMEVVQSGTNVELVAEACAIQIPEIPIAGQPQPIIFDVPVETVRSVAGVMGVGTLSSTDTCAVLETEQFTIVLGARLDPASAPLPSADEDGAFPSCAGGSDCVLSVGSNCVCDQELDGLPGATLNAFNVPAVNLDQVYVTLRTQFSLRGEVFSSELLVGEIDASIEQSILGCRLAAGTSCNPAQVGAVKNLNPEITPQPGNPSTFRAVRVEPGASCADIIAQKSELFPR